MGRTDEGATTVEYSLMAGLIAVVIVGAVGVVGTSVAALFQLFLTGMGW